MEEEWKDIEGYEGLYKVSSYGRIKCLPKVINNGRNYARFTFTKEKIMKLHYDKDGYLRIGLTKNKKQKQYYVHRIVAQAFIPNSENKPQINHINGIKNDNRIENLEWCTISENQIHSVYVLNNKPPEFKKYTSKENPRNIPVLMLDCDGNILKEFYSSVEAGNYLKRKMNIKAKKPNRNIRRAIEKGYNCYGYYWKDKGGEE